MKINIQFLFFIILVALTSCGSLKLNLTGCETNGQWSEKPFFSKENETSELSFTEEYYLWGNDLTVNLEDFLKWKKMDCHDVKKLRVQINSIFFVKRQLIVFINK